jgi:molybdopterin biosynthesis enzyme
VSSLSSVGASSSAPSPQQHGTIYDVNRPVLMSLLHTYHAEGVDYGIVPDDAAQLESTVRRALEECDIVITSGGESF